MKGKIFAALTGLTILLIGLLLGYLLGQYRPIPALGGWLSGAHEKGPRPTVAPTHTPEQLAQFNQRLEAMQPEVEAFQKEYLAIHNDFHARLIALLTDAQRARMNPQAKEAVDWIGGFNTLAATRVGEAVPATLAGTHQPPTRTLARVLFMLMYKPALHIAADKYHLTPEQQTQLQQLFEARRQAFLTLLEQHPLPLDEVYFSMRDLGLLPASP